MYFGASAGQGAVRHGGGRSGQQIDDARREPDDVAARHDHRADQAIAVAVVVAGGPRPDAISRA
jgi:hypothetical protein